MIIQSRRGIIAPILEQGGVDMSKYKKMYISLFQSITRAIAILQEAQKQTEEMYLSAEQPAIRVPDMSKPDTSALLKKNSTE